MTEATILPHKLKTYVLQFVYPMGNGWAFINATTVNQAEAIFYSQTRFQETKVTSIQETKWYGENMQLVFEGSVSTLANVNVKISLSDLIKNSDAYSSVEEYLASIFNFEDYYTKEEIDTMLDNLPDVYPTPSVTPTNVYTKEEIDEKLQQVEEDMAVSVDSQISSTSTNPVENKAVSEALAGKQDILRAGENIIIKNGVISAIGGGEGSPSKSSNVIGRIVNNVFYAWQQDDSGEWSLSNTPEELALDNLYIDTSTNMVYRYDGAQLKRIYDNTMVPLVESTRSGNVTMSLSPNTFYKFTSGALTSLNLTLEAPASGELSMYSGKFTAGENFSFNVTLDNTTPLGRISFTPGATYEFYIVDNVLSFTMLGDGSTASDTVNLVTLAINHGDLINARAQGGLSGSAYFQYLLETEDSNGNAIKKMIWYIGNNTFIDAFGSVIE